MELVALKLLRRVYEHFGISEAGLSEPEPGKA